jgi:hypothetical protein
MENADGTTLMREGKPIQRPHEVSEMQCIITSLAGQRMNTARGLEGRIHVRIRMHVLSLDGSDLALFANGHTY